MVTANKEQFIVKPIRFTLTKKNFLDLYDHEETRFKIGLQEYIIKVDDSLDADTISKIFAGDDIEEEETEEEETDQ